MKQTLPPASDDPVDSRPRTAVLIATDVRTDADMLRKQIGPRFGAIAHSKGADSAGADFEAHRPRVVLLAFDTLAKAQNYSLSLYRRSAMTHDLPHRTIVLCSREEVESVFTLCEQEIYDDYILYWPLSQDGQRLRMSVLLAMRHLEAAERSSSASRRAGQARRITSLEAMLAQAQGDLDVAMRAAEAAAPVTADPAMLSPIRDWRQSFGERLQPHMEAVRNLQALSADVHPRILLVDDDELQFKLLTAQLRGLPYALEWAPNADAALRSVSRNRPDLVLLDIDLPDLRGPEVLRRMKTTENGRDLPVIMVSGNTERVVVVDAIRSGAAAFIVKPIERELLLQRLATVLGPG